KEGEVKLFDLTAPPEQPKPAVGRQWTDAAVLEDHGRLVNAVAISPDGKSFAAATDGNVTCWDATTRKKLWKTELADAPVFALAYSSDGKSIFVAGKTDVILLGAATGEKGKLFGAAAGAALDNFKRKVEGSRARALAVSR